MNPQLEELFLFDCSIAFLKMLVKHVPRLRSLEILKFNEIFGYTGADVHFEHLTKLSFGHTFGYPDNMKMIPMTFELLEECHFFGPINQVFDTLMRNKHLKKLAIGNISTEQLLRIADELPNLKDISTAYDARDATENVIKFIENGTNLRKISFGNIDLHTCAVVIARFGSQWALKEVQGNTILIKK